jgi:hypothetical protein
MKCLVCHATYVNTFVCPQCGYDMGKPDAANAANIVSAREELRHKTLAYAPDTRVSFLDKLKPWLALAIGLFFFVFWVRACSSHGRLW